MVTITEAVKQKCRAHERTIGSWFCVGKSRQFWEAIDVTDRRPILVIFGTIRILVDARLVAMMEFN